MSRLRIGKQTELSVIPQSIIKTNASNEQEYVAPGANGSILTVVAGVPTWQAPVIPSEFEQYADFTGFPVSGVADVIYLDVAGNKFYVWNGTTYVEVPTAASFSMTAAGNVGTNQTISNGDTLTVKGAANSGVLVTALATDTLDISLNEVKEVFVPASAATTVTASQTPIASTLEVYRNGMLQDLTVDYTLAGAVVTLVEPIGASGGAQLSERISLQYRF